MKSKLMSFGVLAHIVGRLLFSTLLGNLLVTISFYAFTYSLTNLGTYSPWELVLWIDAQSDETKGLLLSSALTISGFLVAFQTATKNWKDQVQATIRLEAASEVQDIYNRICTVIYSLRIYAKNHLDLVERINAGESLVTLYPALQYALSLNEKFFADRAELNSLNYQAIGLIGKHSTTLFAIHRGLDQITSANADVASVIDTVWIQVPIPNILNEPNMTALYLSQVDAPKYRALVDRSDRLHPIIAGKSGMLSGTLRTPVLEYSLGMFLNFWRSGSAMMNSVVAIQRNEPPNMEELEKGLTK